MATLTGSEKTRDAILRMPLGIHSAIRQLIVEIESPMHCAKTMLCRKPTLGIRIVITPAIAVLKVSVAAR